MNAFTGKDLVYPKRFSGPAEAAFGRLLSPVLLGS